MPQHIETALAEGVAFRLGDWLVEPGLNRLSRDETTVQLELRAMDVLVCLATRTGDVVSRQELIDEVWDTEFVSYNTLAARIAVLRSALGDDAKQPRYIGTIPKRGYRLIAPVQEVGGDNGAVEPFPEPDAEPAAEPRPYPGLAAFTAADAANFFGREGEVTALWRRIISRRLLAVFGPSGVGKSSLLSAGVIPAAPAGWGALVFQPGEGPFLSLARALAPELAGDAGGVQQLLGFEDPGVALAAVSRWRGRWDQALVVVDQFEEIFTLNPPEVQARFIALLRRLVDAADVHVVLAMRDDFLHECNSHAELAPIFKELTPLSPPAGQDLQRALTEPAARHLYRFEDRFLVDEMVDEVAEERAALPLLAFAVARLWELRDQEKRQLTREAYQQIGGVSGALARHAEETLNVIGEERLPIVRELFRNLVTAKGTRATRGADELLSVFDGDHRGEARNVLAALIDARLLTSFEEQTPEGEEVARHHRVEVAHESLLASWPRLVRWQTQDAEGVQLRDELRKAAVLWDQKGRPSDRLWTGTAYREFTLWRERYSGGLTDTEDAFAAAMTTLATRRRRRRRLIAASVLLAALVVATVTTGLWRRSKLETSRAEASRLLALGRLELDEHPTAAVACALASLELADSPTARRFALESLWRGPTQILFGVAEVQAWTMTFSPDGDWLAVGRTNGDIELWDRNGGKPRLLSGHVGSIETAEFGPDSEILVSVGQGEGAVIVWSVPTGAPIRRLDLEGITCFRLCAAKREIFTFSGAGDQWIVRGWPLDGGQPRFIGRLDLEVDPIFFNLTADVDSTGSLLAYAEKRSLRVVPLDQLGSAPARVIGTHDGEIHHLRFHPGGELIAAVDGHGEIRLWPSAEGSSTPVLSLQGQQGGIKSLRFDVQGSRLAAAGLDQTVRIWDLDGPPGSAPLVLLPGDVAQMDDVAFHPNRRWVATADHLGISLWPLTKQYPVIFSGHSAKISGLGMAPDGSWIATSSWDRTVRVQPLSRGLRGSRITVPKTLYRLAVHPGGQFLLGGDMVGNTYLIPVDGGEFRELEGFSSQVWAVAFSPDGRFAAAGGGQMVPSEGVVRVWDLESEEVRVLDPGDGQWISQLEFTADGQLAVGSGGGVRLWRVDDGTFRVLRQYDGRTTNFALSPDGRHLVSTGTGLKPADGSSATTEPDGEILLQDLETGDSRSMDSHGDLVHVVAFGPHGESVITGDFSGVVRAGPISGDEPHLFLGHDSMIWDLAITPDGRWIASAGDDGTLRLWPMPDISRPPFHTLPYDELLESLRALTNLRAVKDEQSPTGYSIEAGPFTGWETVPTW